MSKSKFWNNICNFIQLIIKYKKLINIDNTTEPNSIVQDSINEKDLKSQLSINDILLPNNKAIIKDQSQQDIQQNIINTILSTTFLSTSPVPSNSLLPPQPNLSELLLTICGMMQQQQEEISGLKKIVESSLLDVKHKLIQEERVFLEQCSEPVRDFYRALHTYLTNYIKVLDIGSTGLVKLGNIGQFTKDNVVNIAKNTGLATRLACELIPVCGGAMNTLLEVGLKEYEDKAYSTISKKILCVINSYTNNDGLNHDNYRECFKDKFILEAAKRLTSKVDTLFKSEEQGNDITTIKKTVLSNIKCKIKNCLNSTKQPFKELFKVNSPDVVDEEHYAKKFAKYFIKSLYIFYEEQEKFFNDLSKKEKSTTSLKELMSKNIGKFIKDLLETNSDVQDIQKPEETTIMQLTPQHNNTNTPMVTQEQLSEALKYANDHKKEDDKISSGVPDILTCYFDPLLFTTSIDPFPYAPLYSSNIGEYGEKGYNSNVIGKDSNAIQVY